MAKAEGARAGSVVYDLVALEASEGAAWACDVGECTQEPRFFGLAVLVLSARHCGIGRARRLCTDHARAFALEHALPPPASTAEEPSRAREGRSGLPLKNVT